MMERREVYRSEPGSTMWRVTSTEGDSHYEVKMGVHRVKRFDSERAANAHFDLWAPEVRHDRLAFGEDD